MAGDDQPERVYAVGDIHGHADRLRGIHDAIRADLVRNPASAMIIHLGDSIDRGPDSAACLEILSAGSPVAGVATVNLMGNHEQMLLDALLQPRAAEHWLSNGGDTTLASWGISADTPWHDWSAKIPPRHLAFVRALGLHHQMGDYVFVHAGVRPGIRLAMQAHEDLLWIRADFLDWRGRMLPEAPNAMIVHGHTPSDAPDIRRNRIGLDTNAGRGGKLTCAALSKDSVYFLQA